MITKEQLKLDRVEDENKGAYKATIKGSGVEAIMTYSRANESLIIVDHTEVPDALRGKGIGAFLAEELVKDARRSGTKVIPLCPFFRAQVEKHPEWRDVVAE